MDRSSRPTTPPAAWRFRRDLDSATARAPTSRSPLARRLNRRRQRGASGQQHLQLEQRNQHRPDPRLDDRWELRPRRAERRGRRTRCRIRDRPGPGRGPEHDHRLQVRGNGRSPDGDKLRPGPGIIGLSDNIERQRCSFTAAGGLSNTDPLLGPLQGDGGPTKTMALAPGCRRSTEFQPAALPARRRTSVAFLGRRSACGVVRRARGRCSRICWPPCRGRRREVDEMQEGQGLTTQQVRQEAREKARAQRTTASALDQLAHLSRSGGWDRRRRSIGEVASLDYAPVVARDESGPDSTPGLGGTALVRGALCDASASPPRGDAGTRGDAWGRMSVASAGWGAEWSLVQIQSP